MSERNPFPQLLAPARIGAMEVRNRVVMAPMMVGYAELDGRFSRRYVDYLAARARGGVGLIVTESVLVESAIQPIPPGVPVARCESDAVIPSLQALVRAVHRHGARIAMQLTPGQGLQSHVAIAGRSPAAASALPAVLNPAVQCRELTVGEIRELTRACADAAYRAAMAGFDMIDLHAHNGYLVDQFMTPLWNRRQDEYGGDLTGRMRFPLEIVQALREAVGQRVAISFRLTAEHGIEGGRTLDEARAVARHLDGSGVDLLIVDAGCFAAEYRMNPSVYLGEGCDVPLAAAIREEVAIPVAAVGNICRPELGEQILARGEADFIALGRSLLADPDWVAKAQAGRSARIRPCIMCNEYCVGRVPAACSVNPRLGRERELAITPAARRRSILVVGGGPAGMEAARVAARRGHDVTLVERNARLGGQLNAGGEPEYKRTLHALRDYLAGELRESAVRVELGSAVDAETVAARQPEAVVVAVGAAATSVAIPCRHHHCLNVLDLHHGQPAIGARVVIAGGGLSGCDAAVDLARQGKEVTLVERLDEIASDLNPISRGALLKVLEEHGVTIATGHEIREIAAAGVVAVDPRGRERLLPADTVVLALGVEPCKALAAALRDRVPEVLVAGDCVSPRKIGEAIHEGYGVAIGL